MKNSKVFLFTLIAMWLSLSATNAQTLRYAKDILLIDSIATEILRTHNSGFSFFLPVGEVHNPESVMEVRVSVDSIGIQVTTIDLIDTWNSAVWTRYIPGRGFDWGSRENEITTRRLANILRDFHRQDFERFDSQKSFLVKIVWESLNPHVTESINGDTLWVGGRRSNADFLVTLEVFDSPKIVTEIADTQMGIKITKSGELFVISLETSDWVRCVDCLTELKKFYQKHKNG